MLTKESYQRHLFYKDIYSFIYQIMEQEFDPRTVIDWGCGNGFLLQLFKNDDVKVIGIEGSEDSKEFHSKELQKDIIYSRIDKRFSFPKQDLVICMEVAEHIDPKYQFVFTDNIVNTVGKYLWWTSAVPGQGGQGHVNCKPLSYWEMEFLHLYRLRVNWELTYKIKTMMLTNSKICLGFPWFRDNLMIFEKGL